MIYPRLEKIKSILVCPGCEKELQFLPESAACKICAQKYPIKNGKIYFIKQAPAVPDSLDKMKQWLKQKTGSLYYKIGVDIVAPTFPFNLLGKITRYKDPSKTIVVDLGCGNRRLHDHVIGLDFFDYDAVDIICDMTLLPFKAGSVDMFVSRSVIEHLEHPQKVVENIRKCTCSGGWGLHLIPFLFPVHASPHDYQRYTAGGQKTLFSGFSVIEQSNPTGPVTLFLLCTIEFFSISLSFGSQKIKAFFYLLFCGLLFPIKYLDIFFVNRRTFLSIAPSIFTVLRKEN